MAQDNQDIAVLGDLLSQADAIAQLLKPQGVFDAAYAAFRAEDPKAFQAVLDRAELRIHCERICHWIRTKECVFLVFELAGPPAKPVELDPRVLAKAITHLAGDEALVRHLADVLVKHDRDGFADILKKLEIAPYAHLFAHWLCTIRYRLVCHWICHGPVIERPVLWSEIQHAARAVADLAHDEKAFRTAVAAATAGDAAKLGLAIRGAKLTLRCHFVCEFFCSWRCILVCLRLGLPYPFAVLERPAQIGEAHEFADVVAKLEANPTELMRFSNTVGAGNLDVWNALIKQFGYERFAIQLCRWICGWRCFAFCKLVCINPDYHPWFTHIGDFSITGDISAATGLTIGPRGGHGGPDYGFFGMMSLRGFCPKKDPAHPSEDMAYRFLFQPAGIANPIPIGPGFTSEVLVGTRRTLWNGDPNTLQTVRVTGSGVTSPTPPTPSANPTPPDHFIVPDPDGWVAVDQSALDDAFSGYLLGFNSVAAITPNGIATTGVAAGTAVPAADQKHGIDCAIIFQATRVSTISHVNDGTQLPDYSNQIDKVRINNWSQIALLDILQFHTGGGTPCSPLSTKLDIEYSVDHELIADWSIGISTAAPGIALTPPTSWAWAPPPAPPTRGAAATHHEDISAWPTCSYTVTLNTRRRLTNGLNDDPNWSKPMTFCIGRRVVRPG